MFKFVCEKWIFATSNIDSLDFRFGPAHCSFLDEFYDTFLKRVRDYFVIVPTFNTAQR